jgi:hypothetical protein
VNTYHHLTNDSNSDKLDSVEDQLEKSSLESQMAYCGKTPSQLFAKPHPQRE